MYFEGGEELLWELQSLHDPWSEGVFLAFARLFNVLRAPCKSSVNDDIFWLHISHLSMNDLTIPRINIDIQTRLDNAPFGCSVY